MKQLNCLFILIIFFAFNACSVTQFHYSSNAEIPHYSTSTETKMNVILNDTNNNRAYGVITAVDNNEIEYLLIAPKNNSNASRSNDISDFNITEASYIDIDAARNFSESLRQISSEWDNLDTNDGYFYEFSSVPETDLYQVNEEVVRFAPSIRFYFNVTDEGSTGELIIEHRNYRTSEVTIRSIDFNRQDKIDDLRSLLEIGIRYFE